MRLGNLDVWNVDAKLQLIYCLYKRYKCNGILIHNSYFAVDITDSQKLEEVKWVIRELSTPKPLEHKAGTKACC